MFSHTNQAFVQVGNFGTSGYGIYGILTSNNTIRGNIFLDGAKGTGVRITTFNACAAAGGPWSSGNTVRDNIIAHGQGGAMAFAENDRDSFYINNLVYGVFFSSGGGKGNNPGSNDYLHNTFIATDYTWMLPRIETDDCAPQTGDLNAIYRSNLSYTPLNVAAQKIMYATGQQGSMTSSDNLFWSPVTPSSNWFNSYSPVGTDILQQPVFVNPAQGNYTLATGSPGKTEGHDGADIGIAYNSYLTTAKVNSAINLPVQEVNTNTGSQTSHTFTVTPGHWYQAFAYLPDSGYWTGNQTWNVEGANSSNFSLQADVFNSCCGPYAYSAPVRWLYLGTRPAGDTSFTISWQNANSTAKLRIRQMPTPAQAYTWITGAAPTPTPTPTPSPTPSPSPKVIPGVIQAEDYSTGGEGVAYHDTTPGNTGGAYRSDDVDIKNVINEGPTVGYTANGEWLAYTVNVQTTGSYTPSFRVGNYDTANASLHLEVDGTNATGPVSIPPTGGWDTHANITGPNVTLTQGTHTLKVVFDAAPFDFNSTNFTLAATPTPTPTPTPGPVACHQYTPSTTIPTGFASPYDVVSAPTTNLMNATCLNLTDARLDLGKGDPLQYIYNTGYLFKTGGTAWTPISYTSTEQLIANAWYPKTATTNISMTTTELANPSYNLAYICSWTGSNWKCGCRDSACTQSYWMIQSFKR